MEDIIPTRNNEPTEPIGSTVLNGEIGKEISANDSDFTLKSVLVPEVDDEKAKFIFLDIELRNNTDSAYTISTLNNFYLQFTDGTKIYSDALSQLNAEEIFKKGSYYVDPFDIPSNGQFSGIIGGFTVSKDIDEFKLCYFPTGSNPNDKGTVIEYQINSADLSVPETNILK